MKIRELLSDESKWTKGCYARDAEGRLVDMLGPHARCWCLSGALSRCYREFGDNSRVRKLLRANLTNGDTFAITVFNDAPTTTFADVKALVERLDV